METRTVEQVESWQSRSFDDGFAGLRELSDGEFSGAVRAGGAWLFMLNGRIIGVYEGSLDDFEDADGTAYAAPHPSLPLLFSMQEQGGETQAKYYTNKTPLSEVDSTLTSGNFTGYVELSENVLSGDYYVAYYGGRSMSVAFVGQSEQVVTGDEAFERANDEVGIYEVRDVDVEVTDVPEPDEPDESPGAATAGADSTPGGAGGASGVGTGASGASGSTVDESNVDSGGTGGPSESSATRGGVSGGAGATTGAGGSGTGGVTESDPTGATPSEVPSADSGSSRDRSVSERRSGADESGADRPPRVTRPARIRTGRDRLRRTPDRPRTDRVGRRGTRRADVRGANWRFRRGGDRGGRRRDRAVGGWDESGRDRRGSGRAIGVQRRRGRPDSTEGDDEADAASAFEDEEEWRETTTIPSLDPDRSEGPDDTASASSETALSADDTSSPGRTSSTSESPSSTQSGSEDGASATRTSAGGTSGGSGASSGQSTPTSGPGASSTSSEPADETGGESQARVRKLRSQLEQRKQQVEQLKQRLSNVESERNEYKRERDALRQEVERLEAKLETTGGTGSGSTNRQLDRSQAFDGTNLFVRYESKGKATLDEAANDAADASDVNANLRLEHHTQFEADDVDVDGEPFEEFLTSSFEYQFASWVVEELLYEIRDTGHRASLKDLYESIPKIDRVDLHGSVSAGGADDDTRQESFDVIMRDRMGNPLVLADLNGSRDPTTGEMMGSLVDAATGVAQAHDELSGAFQVTESFFEPEALETAESATSGGFLSREKRESFVKLSRKRGYHLCLVESRSGGFHLNVPEL
ncbi:transcriptional regulator [Halorussus sp. MSC15.2]|uniref:DUF7527 domain-containing protein n=1 Tax=Halorussus sp. MSC15.2 TaxID=2283638 RepID=UPI0013D7E53D|nr:transcriptional regulator [Halorussus sp. MSC15.2]NEU56923.1 transcriptional regulator [Halorussus sp. MSC15.2]